MFATGEALTIFSECDHVLCDGTFKACPIPYYQLYVMVGLWENQFLPLVFCFLSGKTTYHYRKVFQVIYRKVRRVTGRAKMDAESDCY